MIRRNGSIFCLETPHTTLVIKADTAEYLYYGKKLVSAGNIESCRGLPCKLLSQFRANGLLGDLFLFREHAFRIAPPLTITDNEIDIAITRVIKTLNSMTK